MAHNLSAIITTMHKIYLSDAGAREDLYPVSATRPVADIRVGILTIREKWNRLIAAGGLNLQVEVGADQSRSPIPSHVLPSPELVHWLAQGKRYSDFPAADVTTVIKYPWDIVRQNDNALREDFRLLTKDRITQPIPAGVNVTNPENIFIEDGAVVNSCYINASAGPVYIGVQSEIMEGAMIRGPFALCDHSVLRMGAKVYGSTTIGPGCIAGGEIKNSVMQGYSNKAHDGYLGDSYIGEWCNLGAGTSNSNIRNTASGVSVYHKASDAYIQAGLKAGLIMGDYSNSAINTSFNTGTIVE